MEFRSFTELSSWYNKPKCKPKDIKKRKGKKKKKVVSKSEATSIKIDLIPAEASRRIAEVQKEIDAIRRKPTLTKNDDVRIETLEEIERQLFEICYHSLIK